MSKQKQQPQQPEEVLPVKAERAGGLVVSPYDEADLGGGFEGMTSDDFAIPFINILQKGSPQVEEENGAYIPGARPGMAFNSVTNELFDVKAGGIVLIPVHTVHQFIEWVPRNAGGGFVGVHAVESPEVQDAKHAAGDQRFGKLQLNGNDLVETYNVFAVQVKPDGSYEHVILSMASTNIKAYRKWMTTAHGVMLRAADGRRVPAPLWAHQYKLNTVYRENAKGTWYAWNVGFAAGTAEECRLAPDDYLYQAAKSFRSLVTSGQARAAYESTTQETSNPDDDEF